MTLKGWVKQELMARFPSCFNFEGPVSVDLLTSDQMQFAKSSIPPNITTVRLLVNYFANQVIKLTDRSDIVVASYDRHSPEVKKMVTHTGRYERRCKVCKKGRPELPRGVEADASYFDPNCKKGCIRNQIMWFENGPYLSKNADGTLPFPPSQYDRFCGDSRNLQAELWPLIADALMAWVPPQGKMVFVNGLPFNTRVVEEYDNSFVNNGFAQGQSIRRGDLFQKRIMLDFWNSTALEQHRKDCNPDEWPVVLMEGLGGGMARRIHVPEMENTIHESDNALFFFPRFFPERRVHMACINDGDAISIGLFRAMEDYLAPNSFKHEHWLCLPQLSEQVKRILGRNIKHQYVNLTKLLQQIEDSPEFVNAGVQSPVATMVFLVILSGSDFFKDEFCFGINGSGIKRGKLDADEPNEDEEEKELIGVWKTFFDNLPAYSHMIQYYPNSRDPTVERTMVIDPDLFRLFTQDCYRNKYQASVTKKRKGDSGHGIVDYKDIVIHCSRLKDRRKHAPTDEVINRWRQQILWNLLYWCNAFRNIYIDPFEEYLGASYFGYDRNSRSITSLVSPKQKPMDEVYKVRNERF